MGDEIKGYFKEVESERHMKAKYKLFELIKSRRIKIKDQHGIEYEVFTNKYEKEFLHVESFIMDYSNQAIFSNDNSPCKSKDEISPLCSQEGYYGAFEELPCEQCIINSLGDIRGSSRFASYRPDVAFGYNGIHKIWLELYHKNKSSEYKKRFCHDNNIVLLEISCEKVEEFNDYNGELIFSKLIYEKKEVNLDKYEKFIEKELNDKRYVGINDLLLSLYKEFDSLYEKEDVFNAMQNLKSKYDLLEYDNSDFEFLKSLGVGRTKKILLPKSMINNVHEMTNKHKDNVDNEIYNIFKKLSEEVNDNGYMMTTEFRERVDQQIPKGYKFKVNYNDMFEEFGLVNIYIKHHMEYLKGLGMKHTNKSMRALIPKVVLDEK